jgi:hypothetical protein
MTRKLSILLDEISRFKKVYVAGPQRSGTTFTAKYLAKALGYKHIDEHDFGTHNYNAMLKLISQHESFVIQCPAQTHNIENFPLDADSIVVFMRRDVYDIIISEHRIDWHTRGAEKRERDKYVMRYPEYTKPFIPISIIKYKVWDFVQKNKIGNYIDFDYNILKDTDMWIDKEDRKNFKNKQTS